MCLGRPLRAPLRWCRAGLPLFFGPRLLAKLSFRLTFKVAVAAEPSGEAVIVVVSLANEAGN